MASINKTLYVGMTNSLERRVYQHKFKVKKGFTSRYNIFKLVHFESTDDVGYAIGREKQIKGWTRNKKIELIESMNPSWQDLSADWYAWNLA